MTHTLGPWKAHYLPQHRIRVTTNLGVPALGDDTICEVALWNVDYEEQQANARLIAAAPNLLVALKAMMHGFQADAEFDPDPDSAAQKAWDLAETAINNAVEGKPK